MKYHCSLPGLCAGVVALLTATGCPSPHSAITAATPLAVKVTPAITVIPELTLTEKQALVDGRWCRTETRVIQVVNPRPVRPVDKKATAYRNRTDRDQTFAWGDDCLTDAGGWNQGVALDTTAAVDRVLVVYYPAGERRKWSSCPAGVMAFFSLPDFLQQCDGAAAGQQSGPGPVKHLLSGEGQ